MEITPLAATNSAQVSDISEVKRKMHLTGKITKTTLAGAVVDIGLDIPGVVHISQLQKEPVNKVEDVIKVGQEVDVWVRRVDPKKGRIELTMIEPLALEWREMSKDMVVKGKVTRLEKFGAFVDIGTERPGLVHISEMTHDYLRSPKDVVNEGDEIDVKILAINRRKKQIKLSMKALEEKPTKAPKPSPRDNLKGKEIKGESENAKEEPVPTAMEIALRDAMEKAQTHEDHQSIRGKRKGTKSKKEIEQILTRTLEHKVKTSSK
ncbi:MAG: S1 RNA-binding domain-containing protein [Anaerolineales bacterium]|nr:S1 RNA-binding domain-containing protein [Anaerolineales bacterium]